MARAKIVSNLHRLTVREVQAAAEGDHSDGGGLMLRIRGSSCAWVFRFTAPTGRRREMGLGVAHRSNAALTGSSLTAARDLAHGARDLLQRGQDPIEERDKARTAARDAEQQAKVEKVRQRTTLARAARDYHERVIEPSRTTKHAAQWIASLENHMPAALWHQPIDQVTAPELLAMLQAMTPHERARNTDGGTPHETQQRIRQRLDAVFEDAIFHGLCGTNPVAAIKRKLREAKGRRERGQFAALPYREAPAFMAELRRAEGIAARCLEFAVLTAARPDVIEACLAHEESNRIRAAYNRAAFTSDRRALLEAWAEFLSIAPASNVLQLRA